MIRVVPQRNPSGSSEEDEWQERLELNAIAQKEQEKRLA